jgi:methyl-accepting chemotaxis protein
MKAILKSDKIGIAEKTSLISGVIVFVLLGIVSIILILFQFGLISSVIKTYTTNVNEAIDQQGANQKADMETAFKINADITAGIAAQYLYNVDPTNLQEALKPFLKLPGVVAVRVSDADNQNFAASWNNNGEIQSGQLFPDDVKPDEAYSFKAQASQGGQNLGTVQLFYSDATLIKQLENAKTKSEEKVTNFRKTIKARLFAGLGVQVVMFIVVVVVLNFTIVFCLKILAISPIKRVIEGLKDMAEGEGDLTRRLKIKNMDEIGMLASWFNMFVEKLQTIIKDVIQTAETLGVSANELTSLSATMKTGSGELSKNSSNVASATSQMSGNMNSISAAMEEASANVNMVASAAEEMTATINEIAENSSRARSVSEKAVSQVSDATEKVSSLGKAALEINKFTEVITEISEQTNLLALNATIEAARAGEAGKGFSVVANEIKELAKQTSEATLDIKNRITGIQNSTTDTTKGIGQIASVISDISNIVTTIASSIEEQSATTREIAGNVSQMSLGIQEVNENVSQSSHVSSSISNDINQMTDKANEMSDHSSKVSSNAQELSNLAGKLNSLVGRFKV